MTTEFFFRKTDAPEKNPPKTKFNLNHQPKTLKPMKPRSHISKTPKTSKHKRKRKKAQPRQQQQNLRKCRKERGFNSQTYTKVKGKKAWWIRNRKGWERYLKVTKIERNNGRAADELRPALCPTPKLQTERQIYKILIINPK